MPCCCLNCPSADTYDSSGYLLCNVSAYIAPLRILMILVAICRTVILLARILMMLVAIEVAISIYYLKGIAESGIHKS